MVFLFYTCVFLFVLLCGLLALVILIQDSKSMGLGASFGGGDSSDSVFGTSAADILKKFTAYLAAAFMIACVGLSLWTGSIARAKAKSLPVSIEEVQK